MMKPWHLLLGLLMLVACGTSDLQTGQQPAGPTPQVAETSILLDDHYTPPTASLPVSVKGGWHIDGAQARSPSPMVITSAETVTIILSTLNSEFDQEIYAVRYDPTQWVRLVEGKEVPFEDILEPYPEGGWVLKPLGMGYATFSFAIYQDDPSICAPCSEETMEHKHFNFYVEPAAAVSTPVPTNDGIVLDGVQSRYPNPMVITTAETITITLSQFQSAFPHEKYRIQYDHTLFMRLMDGQEVKYHGKAEPYPAGGWVLKPLEPGYTVVLLSIYADDPARCTECFSDEVVIKPYTFVIEAAP